MNGKQKCRILREIRQQIARENDIDLVIEECRHKGNCRGTCPRCESEVRYLEQALERRRLLQKRVALAGISAGVTLALSGCAAVESVVDAIAQRVSGTPEPEIIELMGDVPYYTEPPEEVYVTDGEVAPLDSVDAEDGETAPYDLPETTASEPAASDAMNEEAG